MPSTSLAPAILLSLASCAVPELGLLDGQLTPCPGSPNCVSSLAVDEAHRVEAFPLVQSVAVTCEGLKAIVATMPRTTLLRDESHYLRFEFTSLMFRFKDDVEFHIVPADELIHVRSASRVGHSDFGVNRRRVAALRLAYDAWLDAK
jgi:uncharacterized protein (DUF1499 family)